MTQKNKNLLLKDICARLPYGVKCSFGVDDAIYEVCGVNPTCCGASEIQATHIESGINGDFKLNSCKPYLFPLSSMTLEQRCKVRDLLPDKCEISFANSEINFYGEDYHKIKLEQLEKLFNLFNMWHIDYRNFIGKELAIDATGLNIYEN